MDCFVCSLLLYLTGFAIIIGAVLFQTRFRYHVKMVIYLLCICIGGTIGGLVSIPFGRTTENHFRIFRIFQFFCSVFNLKFIFRNKEYIDSDEPFVIIANHQSALDVLTSYYSMTYCWPKNCVVMLKSSLKFLPGFNICAYVCNSIYINRFSKEKAHKTVDNTLNDIISNKRKVWIYPEGTRNAKSEMLPFKKGAFIIAKQAKIPVVCVVFSPYRFWYDYDKQRFDNNGEVIAQFLPPIDSNKFETVDELLDHCRSEMQKTYNQLDEELAARYGDKKNL